MLWTPWVLAQGKTDLNSCCRIAVVNMAEVLERSPQADAEEKKLAISYKQRERQLSEEKNQLNAATDAFQRIRPSLSNQERVVRESELRIQQRDYSRRLEDFREDLRFSRDKALENLQEQVINAIETVRQQEGIDIIFRENNYIVASDRVNLTEKVLSYLQKRFESQDTSAVEEQK